MLVTLVTAGGFVLARHSVESQNLALLRDEASQASLYVSSLAGGLGSTLQALAADVSATDASPLAFEFRAERVAFGESFLLARRGPAGYTVLASSGPAFTSGQVLSPALSRTLAAAGSSLRPGPVMFGGKTTTLGFALGPPLVPTGTAIYEQITIDPYLAVSASQGKPFEVLHAAVYSSKAAKHSQLVLANTRQLPLTGSVIGVPVSIGSSQWWIRASAREPLAGTFPNDAPYLVLGIGLLLAVALAAAVEVLARRNNYSAMLVGRRTAELLESQRALVQSERLSAIGRMTTVVGHELRTPLGAVLNELFLARTSLDDPAEATLHLEQAERCTELAANLASDLTSYSRVREPALAPVDLPDLLAEVFRIVLMPDNVRLNTDIDDVACDADREQMTQILVNVITNAIQAMPEGGELTVAARRRGADVAITVADDGEGVDTSVADTVFEPFVTTKPTGTGLGLAVVRQLTEAHGGRVTLENRAEGGAVVTITIPARPVDAGTPASPPSTDLGVGAAHPESPAEVPSSDHAVAGS
ncbi:MAG TPA: HAMP domain-containing sensor histidine kinase [Acidimicrobiales bacterium]|nr:HAMP domain-containing sensor histidine kinase [Acidimicrobiales bacterium]